MHGTTMQSVVDFYRKYEPHVGITEQVAGFGQRTSTTDPTSPYRRPRLVSLLIELDVFCLLLLFGQHVCEGGVGGESVQLE